MMTSLLLLITPNIKILLMSTKKLNNHCKIYTKSLASPSYLMCITDEYSIMTKTSNQQVDDSIVDLLTIKQAARLLNVSEVSLRRWTNAGQLPCLRVGTHRARRFRRADLMSFMEKQSGQEHVASKVSESALQNTNHTHAMLEGSSISFGSHLCSFYDDAAGQLKLSVPLLAEGIHQDNICFLISTPKTRKIILKQLSEIGIDVKSLIKNEKLIVSEGLNDPTEMLGFLQNQMSLATRSGSRPLRLVGDMSWALAKKWSMDELNSFELTYNNTLGHQYLVISLCQYDARDFSGVNVLNALRSHEDTFRYPVGRFLGTSPTKVVV